MYKKANEEKEIIEALDPKDIIEKNKKVCKGVKAVVLKNQITHQGYQNVLETDEPAKRDIISIRSFNHQLYTHKTADEIALSSFYDKMRMIDNISCVPFGYNPVSYTHLTLPTNREV